MLYMWLNYLILLSNITSYYYCNIIIVHIIIVHIIIVFTLLMEAIHLSINILWIINCKYYRYIASYSYYCPPAALYRYNTAPRYTGIILHPGSIVLGAVMFLYTGRNHGRKFYTAISLQ